MSGQRRHLIPVAAAVLPLLLAIAPPAGAHYKNTGAKYCGYITFERNTDSGASGIEAKGTACKKARRMARAVQKGNRRPFGYLCRGRSHDSARFIAHRDWKCTRDGNRVTWIAT